MRRFWGLSPPLPIITTLMWTVLYVGAVKYPSHTGKMLLFDRVVTVAIILHIICTLGLIGIVSLLVPNSILHILNVGELGTGMLEGMGDVGVGTTPEELTKLAIELIRGRAGLMIGFGYFVVISTFSTSYRFALEAVIIRKSVV